MEGLVEAMNECILAAVEHAGCAAIYQSCRNGHYANESAGRSEIFAADFLSETAGHVFVRLDDLAGYGYRAAENHASAQSTHTGNDERAINYFFYAIIRCKRRCNETSSHDC